MPFILLYGNSEDELVRRLKDVEQGSLSSDEIVGSGPYKAAITFKKKSDAVGKIAELVHSIINKQEVLKLNEGIFYTSRSYGDKQLAFLFSGQGSQHKSMLKKFSEEEKYQETFSALNEYSKTKHKACLESLIYDNEDQRSINETQWTQPALAIVCVSLYQLLLSKGLKPEAFAGHSFGELVALYASATYDEKTLLDLSFERGRLMSEANKIAPGAMLAVVDKDAESYLDLINKLSAYLSKGKLELANINTHNQIVLSGRQEAVNDFERVARELSLRSTPLRASAAFHSSLMKPAQQSFYEYLAQVSGHFYEPKHFVASNVEGATYHKVQSVVQNLSQQLASQVNWVSTVSRLFQNGARVFCEIGPRNILSKMVDDILPEKECITLSMDGMAPLENYLVCFRILGLNVNLSDLSPADEQESHDLKNVELLETDNKIVANYMNQQKLLLNDANKITDAVLRKKVQQEVLANIESVINAFFDSSSMVEIPTQEDPHHDDEISKFVKTEISRLTGFDYQEISVEKNLETDLMLDSITKMDMFASISQRYKNNIESVDELFNLKTVNDIINFLRKIESKTPVIKEALVKEQLWLRDELAAVTGFSPSEITVQMNFSEDLMLDSIMRAEVFSSFAAEFPQHSFSEEDFTSIQSIEDLGTWISKKVPTGQRQSNEVNPLGEAPSFEQRETKKFSTSFRNALSEYLQRPLEEIHSNSHFEFDLKLTIFEKEEILNSLILEYPYVQIAGRALLNAQTVGQVLDIERSVDKRSSERDEEKIGRYKFKFNAVSRHPFQEGNFVRPVYIMPILCEGAGKTLEDFLSPLVETVSSSVELEEDISLALEELTRNLKSKTYDLFFVFKSHSRHFTEYNRSLRLIHGLGQKLLDLGAKYPGLRVKVLFDAGENFYLKGLVGFFRSLVREVNLSLTIVEMCWHQTPTRELPWDLLWSAGEGVDKCQSYRAIGKDYFEEVLTEDVIALDKKLTLDIPDQVKVLIMGGGRGITSEISKYFASHHAAWIYAVGRTKMPAEYPYRDIKSNKELRDFLWDKCRSENRDVAQEELSKKFNYQYDIILKERELWKTKDNIEQRGGKFSYYSADLSNPNECLKTLELIEKVSGGIQGVVHAPGLILDRLLSRKSYEDFSLVVRTKADSAYTLYDFYKDKNLYFAKLLSSLSSWSGAPGQTDYALANEIINRLAQDWNQKSSYPVASLLWSVWSETGLASSSLIQQMKKMNLGLITNQAGTRHFKEDLLYSSGLCEKVMFTPRSTLDFSLKVKNYEV